MERELMKSGVDDFEQKVHQIFDAIPQHILVANANGDVLFVNQTALDYHGVTLDAIRSKDSLRKFCHPEDLAIIAESNDRSIASGLAVEFKARVLRKDGLYRWFLIQGNPVRDEQGHVTRWYGTRTDIEDQVRAEERLRLVIDTTTATL